MAEKQNTHKSYKSTDWVGGCSQEPQMRPGQGLYLLHFSSVQGLPKAAAAGAELLLPSQLAELGAEGVAPPAPLSWKQTNTLLHTCFNHSLNVNMEETPEMTGWLLTFPPCNAHILRAPTGRLIYQNKHTKKAKLFALILGINYLTSWLKSKQEKLKKELLEVNFPSTFKENNLLKL